MIKNNLPWKLWQKVTFRFLFFFLGLTTLLCWDLSIFFTMSSLSKSEIDPSLKYKPLVNPFYWLDRHIFHMGYNPSTQESFPQDNHFGAIYYLMIIVITITGTLIWSLLDNKRSNYNRLFYWFNLYLRYVLAITMFGYGLDKLIPVQMHNPNVVDMNTPYGNQTLFKVLWNFMGVSSGYMILVGASELIAAFLLLFRRTLVFGCLFMICILANVAAMNWFYNVPVKMFSAQLTLYTLYLLAPYAGNLFQYFFSGTPATLNPARYTFDTRWKKHSLTSALVIIPFLFFVLLAFGGSKRYAKLTANARKERIYDVTTFIAKDTVPPLTTDTLRWSRLMLFVYGSNAVVYNMKNEQQWYECDVDSTQKTYTLHDTPDLKKWYKFHYTYAAKGQLQLTGTWKGQQIKVLLKSAPVDSIPLNHEKIKLIND